LARGARVLVATARELATLRRGAVELDALVGSGKDEAEIYHPGDLDPEPRLVVTTSGALGGWGRPGGPPPAAPPPRPGGGRSGGRSSTATERAIASPPGSPSRSARSSRSRTHSSSPRAVARQP